MGSLDETKWNPGLLSKSHVVPDFASRHPGYTINKSKNSPVSVLSTARSLCFAELSRKRDSSAYSFFTLFAPLRFI
jgi:hypothetical protein